MKKLILLTAVCLLAQIPLTAQEDFTGIEVPAEIRTFVEAGTKPIALESADLNGDGTKDFILVIEREKLKTTRSRIGPRPGICTRARLPTSGMGRSAPALLPKA